MKRTHTKSLLALASLALLMTSCSTSPTKRPTAVQLRWPPPPEPARIAYVTAATRPSELGATVPKSTRLVNWITGSQKGNEPFAKPFGLGMDEHGGLLVADTGNNSVSWFESDTRRWHHWQRINKQPFQCPVAVAKMAETLYVADSLAAEVVAFNQNGRLQFRLREGLSQPSGVAARNGSLYVADARQHAVLVFDDTGKLRQKIGERGNQPGQFNYPTHLALDAAGNLHVTDSMNGRIQVFADGKFLREFGRPGDSPGHFGRPKGLAVDAEGNTYVLDAMFDCLQIFNSEGRLLLTLGAAGNGPGEFCLPNGIAITRDGQIFVADAYNGRIQVLRKLGPP